jgi:hypothetical protein
MIETARVTQFSLPHMSTRPGADQSTLFAPSLRRGKVSLSSSTEARRARVTVIDLLDINVLRKI